MREAIEELRKGWVARMKNTPKIYGETPTRYTTGLTDAYVSCIRDLDKVIKSNSPDPRQDMIKVGLDQRETDVEPNSAGRNPAAGSTLADELPQEIKKNRELLEHYKEIGADGGFGAAMIEEDIDRAVNALASGDVVRMLKAYEAMKNNQ